MPSLACASDTVKQYYSLVNQLFALTSSAQRALIGLTLFLRKVTVTTWQAARHFSILTVRINVAVAISRNVSSSCLQLTHFSNGRPMSGAINKCRPLISLDSHFSSLIVPVLIATPKHILRWVRSIKKKQAICDRSAYNIVYTVRL